jgi:PTS system nitrogen regulatory IIA component
MTLNEAIAPARVLANARAANRKAALEALAQLLCKDVEELDRAAVLRALVSRERLGCTAIGAGLALPHGRSTMIDSPIGALIKLADPIDYEAADDRPVDILVGLLIPDSSAEDDTELVSAAAGRLADPEICRCLRSATTSKALHACLIDREQDIHRLYAGLGA